MPNTVVPLTLASIAAAPRRTAGGFPLDPAAQLWRGLAQGSRRIVDQLDRGGLRHIVARRNALTERDRGLTRREQQVVTAVAKGLFDKEAPSLASARASPMVLSLRYAGHALPIHSEGRCAPLASRQERP
jgi:hypothetical protein